MPHPFALICSTCLLAVPAAGASSVPVAAAVESTLETAGDHIRQYAYDGDADTYYASTENAGLGDCFTLKFDRPVALKSVAVSTGRPDDRDRLESGTLEASADGKTFETVAKLASGRARGDWGGKPVRAVRVQATAKQDHPLVVREFTVESDPKTAVFLNPIEFAVDVADAPEMKEWAEQTARVCEQAFPMINEELKSPGFHPPRRVTMSLKSDYRGVAEAGGQRIKGSVKFFKDHPDDVGAMVHETVHIVQRYPGRNNPGWLVEGVADYVRFFRFEPGKLGPIDPERSRYDSGYRVSAAFLAYLTEKYDKEIVRKLNRLMREGRYREAIFEELTGKPLRELGREWKATLRR